jgi:hypothetical protein
MQLTKKRKTLPGFICCRQSALSICMVSFVNAQCRETRSLAANRSLRVSILLAAEGNTIERRFVLPLAFADTTGESEFQVL